jgi:hypothetical protein
MRHAQADSDAVVVEIVKWIGGHDLKEKEKRRLGLRLSRNSRKHARTFSP